jgi:AcrR family transcriptional regulator
MTKSVNGPRASRQRATTQRATGHSARQRAAVVATPPTLPTRAVILDTAERLFAARGVDGVALRDLAREMHLTAPSLYNHFPSKQALYDAVLERGLHPIVDILAEAWTPGALRPDRVRATLDRLTTHLATHPHLARLLQRALLDDGGSFQALIARWIAPLYRQGIAVIEATADEAGWEAGEIPYLGIGLFGMVFAVFTNIAVLRQLGAWDDPTSESSLAIQRQVLQKAVYRLLGPQPPNTD